MKAQIKQTTLPPGTGRRIFIRAASGAAVRACFVPVLIAFIALAAPAGAAAQRGNHTLWGDVKIDDSKAETPAPQSLTIIVYDQTTKMVGRQNVSSRGRYRISNLPPGNYEVAIEVEDREIARVPVVIVPSTDTETRQDFEFEWKSNTSPKSAPAGVISAADAYNRNAANKSLFQKAQEAVEKKKYEQAGGLLKQIVDSDKLDFQVWNLLGTVYRIQEKPADAEKAYLSAIEVRPAFSLALLNLGRLRVSQKRFEEAVEPLTRATTGPPPSPEAHLLLGETYLQLRMGSKAVPHLNEAARAGLPEAHLRLAWLYNAAGMKDKAAAEYEEFLKKKPDYPERKKLKDYISANK